MSIALDLEPYAYSTDLGPDDLSDVDLNHPKFRAAFPDGKVPIRHVPMPSAGGGDGFFAWAENVLTIHEHVRGYDVDAIAETRERLINFQVRNGDGGSGELRASQLERKVLVSKLMQVGMTLRQIARYVGWPHREVASAVSEKSVPAALMKCDEALSCDEAPSVRQLARTYGLDQTVVTALKRLRLGQSPDPRSAAAWEAACTRVEAA